MLLSNEKKAELLKEMKDLLDQENYHYTHDALEKIIEKWHAQKGSLIEMFSKHENYNGNYQIVLNEKYYRDIDKKVVYESLEELINYIHVDNRNNIYKMLKEYKNNYNFTQYITETQEEIYNAYLQDTNISFRKGQKTSKQLRKLLLSFEEIKNDPDFEKVYAQLSDAINPLQVERYTILSIHPMDYLKMSYGYNWDSCHHIGNRGCYSSGTISYMLDDISFIMYTINNNEDITKPHAARKITRQVFAYDKYKLLQSRLYPQANDYNENAKAIYQQYREIVQRAVTKMIDRPNYWINKKGTSHCREMVYNNGTAYSDWIYYDLCNISYNASNKENMNQEKINICEEPICIYCGYTHDTQENISCCNAGTPCEYCGEYHNEEDMIYCEDNGCYYCDENCAANDNLVYCVDDYSWHDIDNTLYDENYCEYYRYTDDAVYTDYGSFINEESAESYGLRYSEYDNDWYWDIDIEIDGYTGETFSTSINNDYIVDEDGHFYIDEYNCINNGYMYDENTNSYIAA